MLSRVLVLSCLAFLALFASAACARAPTLDWVQAVGGAGADYGRSIIQTSDGGLLVAGYTNSSGAGVPDWQRLTHVFVFFACLARQSKTQRIT